MSLSQPQPSKAMSAQLFERFSLDPNRLGGKRITVMGLGRFGGGLAAARFFAQRGSQVTVTDLAEADTLEQSIQDLTDLPDIIFHLGRHLPDDFTATDAVVVNPAVPPDSPFLGLARQAKVPLTTEINIFFQLCPARIVGVTGSNGKSTTTAMIASILSAAVDAGQGDFRQVFLGGNIGHSLLCELEQITAADVAVLELSSFQLEALAAEQTCPQVAVWTNLSPNHLDRHATLEAYRKAKENIYRFQGPEDLLIYNADDAGSEFLGSDRKVPGRRMTFSLKGPPADCYLADGWLRVQYPQTARVERVLCAEDLPVPGQHNIANALAATCVAAEAKLPPEIIAGGLKSFKPLPHRLELIASVSGVDYYDDSIATTPESALLGLNSFDKPAIIILGGKDKGAEFDTLLTACVSKAYGVICLGQTRQKLFEKLLKLRGSAQQPYLLEVETLEQAVKAAAALAKPGQVVLLSPGCASYDMFTNFAHRGREFVQIVRALP